MPGPIVSPGEVPVTARRRYAAGRRVRVPAKVRTVRDLLRRHLREEGRDQVSLHAAWNMRPASVKSVFLHGRPLSPQYIDAAVESLQLDEFDALELRLLGAIEAGWQIEPLVAVAVKAGLLVRDGRRG